MKASSIIDKSRFNDLKKRNIYDFSILKSPNSLNRSFFYDKIAKQPDMRNRDLRNSIFYNINLHDKDISFNGSNLEGAIFYSNCNFTYFLPSYFENINFKNARIINQNFYCNKFFNCDLTGAILLQDPSPINGYDKIHQMYFKKCKIDRMLISQPGYDDAFEYTDCTGEPEYASNLSNLTSPNSIRKTIESFIEQSLK